MPTELAMPLMSKPWTVSLSKNWFFKHNHQQLPLANKNLKSNGGKDYETKLSNWRGIYRRHRGCRLRIRTGSSAILYEFRDIWHYRFTSGNGAVRFSGDELDAAR